jgi:hypothetical protein
VNIQKEEEEEEEEGFQLISEGGGGCGWSKVDALAKASFKSFSTSDVA